MEGVRNGMMNGTLIEEKTSPSMPHFDTMAWLAIVSREI